MEGHQRYCLVWAEGSRSLTADQWPAAPSATHDVGSLLDYASPSLDWGLLVRVAPDRSAVAGQDGCRSARLQD